MVSISSASEAQLMKNASGDYDAATTALDAYGVLVTDDEDAVDVDATKAADRGKHKHRGKR